MDSEDIYESGLQALAVGRYVGARVKEQLSAINIGRGRLAEILLPKLKYDSIASVTTYISSVSSGVGINYLQGSERARQRSRERLSRFLHQLDFSEDEEAIKQIKTLDSKFEYPPSNGE